MAAMTKAALLAEIQNDPASMGYAPHIVSGSDNAITALLNTVVPGAPGVVFRGIIDGRDIVAVTDATEYLALTATKQNLYNALTGASGGVDCSSATVRAAFASIFAAGATRTALVALSQKQGTRAEVLWGTGVVVTDNDVSRALGRG